jgi:hypothetical protein
VCAFIHIDYVWSTEWEGVEEEWEGRREEKGRELCLVADEDAERITEDRETVAWRQLPNLIIYAA